MVWLSKQDSEICEAILVTSRMANMIYLAGFSWKKRGHTKTNNKLLFGMSHVLTILSIILHAILVVILEMLTVSHMEHREEYRWLNNVKLLNTVKRAVLIPLRNIRSLHGLTKKKVYKYMNKIFKVDF